jgi:hypothetical protein
MRRAVTVHKRRLMDDRKYRYKFRKEHVQAAVEKSGCEIGKLYVHCDIEQLPDAQLQSAMNLYVDKWRAHCIGNEAICRLDSSLSILDNGKLVTAWGACCMLWSHRVDVAMNGFGLRD